MEMNIERSTTRSFFGVLLLLLAWAGAAQSAPISLDWGALGGPNVLDGLTGGNVPVSELRVLSFDGVSSDGQWLNEVNTFNSNFFLYVALELDGVWKIVATTDPIQASYHTEHALDFHVIETATGILSGIRLSTSLPGAGAYVGLNSNGAGTQFLFQAAGTVSEPGAGSLAVAVTMALLVSRIRRPRHR
jgi:hypothetical protein